MAMNADENREKPSKIILHVLVVVVHLQAVVVRLAALHEVPGDARLQLGIELSPELGAHVAR